MIADHCKYKIVLDLNCPLVRTENYRVIFDVYHFRIKVMVDFSMFDQRFQLGQYPGFDAFGIIIATVDDSHMASSFFKFNGSIHTRIFTAYDEHMLIEKGMGFFKVMEHFIFSCARYI